MTRVILQNLIAVALAWWAWKRCGAPEKIASTALVGAIILNLILRYLIEVPTVFGHPDPGSVALDLGMLVIALALAIRSNRTWPMWFAALQLIALLSHFLRAVVGEIHPISYAILMRAPTYAQELVLLIGMTACTRRAKRGIRASDWRR